ncbi:MAG: acyl-CoA reductase [Crocinitomicaceae bacterium]
MKKQELVAIFTQLGKVCRELGEGNEWKSFEIGVTEPEFEKLIYTVNRQFVYNGWFTKENVQRALLDWSNLLTEEKMNAWLSNYSFAENPKKIGIIMAGNIPLVGFHDFASIVLSGHLAICKLSTDDNTLLPALMDVMVNWNPDFANHFRLTAGKLGEIDAMIATGSNNSIQHFEQYFGHLPHIFRNNRTSIAILDGTETEAEREALGHDIFTYFGLGCRNVSHLLLPENYAIDLFFTGIFSFKDIIYNKKYGNNYDYNKAIFLMNKFNLLDNNFVLLRETEELHSPLAMVHHHSYKSKSDIDVYLNQHEGSIQAIIGHGYLPFGSAQSPAWEDYADGVDTMEWLSNL